MDVYFIPKKTMREMRIIYGSDAYQTIFRRDHDDYPKTHKGGQQDKLEDLGQLGTSYLNQEYYDKARVSFEQALALAEQLDSKTNQLRLNDLIGYCCYHEKLYEKAVTYFQKALSLAQELGDTLSEYNITKELYRSSAAARLSPNKIEFCKRLLVLADQVDDYKWKYDCYFVIGREYFARGDYYNALYYFIYLHRHSLLKKKKLFKPLYKEDADMKRVEEKIGTKEYKRLKSEIETKILAEMQAAKP